MNKREWMLQFVLANPMYDMEDTVGSAARLYDAICAATAPETDWVEHDGDVSKAPEEGRMVEVMFRDGSRCSVSSEGISWDHVQASYDVMRWRYA